MHTSMLVSFPGSKRALGGEEEESLASTVYACTSFTQILFCPCILSLQNAMTRDVIINNSAKLQLSNSVQQ